MTQEIARQSRMAVQLATKQAQVSTGKRLQRASDDPAATARIADLTRAQSNDNARARNIGLGIGMAAQHVRSVGAHAGTGYFGIELCTQSI